MTFETRHERQKGVRQMTVERISDIKAFERCLAASAERPVLLLKHSTT